jgi:hypothetical protein
VKITKTGIVTHHRLVRVTTNLSNVLKLITNKKKPSQVENNTLEPVNKYKKQKPKNTYKYKNQ